MTKSELMDAWRRAEDAALLAEERVRLIGQAAADPRAAAVFEEAKRLRQEADRLLGMALRQVDQPPAEPDA